MWKKVGTLLKVARNIKVMMFRTENFRKCVAGLSIIGISLGLGFSLNDPSTLANAAPRENPCPLGVPKPSKETKVIRNEKYGFSVKIPANYKMSSDGILDPEISQMFKCLKTNKIRWFDIGVPLHILVKPVPSEIRGLSDLGKSEKSNLITDRKEIDINSQAAIIYQLEETSGTGYKAINTELFSLDKRYLITISVNNYNTPYHRVAKQVFYKIINSISFENKSNLSSSTQLFKSQGDLSLGQKQWKDAIAAYTKGIKFSPQYAELYYNRGLAHLSSDNKKAALTNFEEAAELFLRQGKWDDRKDAITMITQIDPALENDYKLTESSRLTLKGIGPVRVGMTIEEASQASGQSNWNSAGDDLRGTCKYFKPQNNLKDVSFMAVDGRIARVDIHNRSMQTLRGIKIGDTEERVKDLYPGQIQVSPRAYSNLTFIPKDDKDKNYRYIFEIHKGRIVGLRSGKLPEVEYIEGCS